MMCADRDVPDGTRTESPDRRPATGRRAASRTRLPQFATRLPGGGGASSENPLARADRRAGRAACAVRARRAAELDTTAVGTCEILCHERDNGL